MAEENMMAKVKITFIGKDGHSFDEVAFMSTDLPDENIGTAVGEVLREAWKRGEDPAYSTIVITFDSVEKNNDVIAEDNGEIH